MTTTTLTIPSDHLVRVINIEITSDDIVRALAKLLCKNETASCDILADGHEAGTREEVNPSPIGIINPAVLNIIQIYQDKETGVPLAGDNPEGAKVETSASPIINPELPAGEALITNTQH